MPTQIAFLEPDPFVNGLRDAAAFIPRLNDTIAPQGTYSLKNLLSVDGTTSTAFINTVTASRPLNGIMVKPNTHATVHIRTAGGRQVRVFNRLGRETEDGVAFSRPSDGLEPNDNVWTDWLLQSVHEERAEKTQIVETFGETYLYAFGQRPRVLSFTGVLLNTLDYNWRAIFWKNWDEYFRATQLIKLNARMYIAFDDIIVEGYPMNAAADQTSADPHIMSFSFSFFVTNYVNVTAQSGFKDIRENINEVVRAGLSADYSQPGQVVDALGNPVEGLYTIANNDLSSSRKPLFTALTGLIPGGSTALDFIYKGDSIPNQLARLALGPDIDTTVAKALLAATNEGYAESQAMSLTNTLLDSALENLSLYKHKLLGQAEDFIGANRGSINTWFGFMADIIQKKTGVQPVINKFSANVGTGEVGPDGKPKKKSVIDNMQADLAKNSLKSFGMFVLVS